MNRDDLVLRYFEGGGAACLTCPHGCPDRCATLQPDGDPFDCPEGDRLEQEAREREAGDRPMLSVYDA